jgi:glycerol uptake facilitator-like aquaporin
MSDASFSRGRRAVSEGVGTALLLATVVGSGIMGERLAGGNVAIALLANTVATGAALVALILTFAPISGAPLNPAVTFAAASDEALPWVDVPHYVGAQCLGAVVGVAIANAMFDLPSSCCRRRRARAHRNGWASSSRPSACSP